MMFAGSSLSTASIAGDFDNRQVTDFGQSMAERFAEMHGGNDLLPKLIVCL